MEKLNKRILSGLLASLLTFGALPALKSEAKAASEDDVVVITEENAEGMDLVEVCHMKGIYNVIVNNVPVYVCLNNNVDNEFLLKNDAVELAKKNYDTDKVYFYSKVIESPNYVKGETPEEERYNFVYAMSDKTSVDGWTRVVDTNVITDGELVASTIELGEFLLKEVDLSRYTWNFSGFGYADLNHDGEMNEIIYVGNEGINTLVDKTSANALITQNSELKVYQKVLSDRTMFALSSTNPGNGWTLSSLSKVNDNVQIGTSAEYMDSIYYIASTVVTTENLYFPKLEEEISVIGEVELPSDSVNMLGKNEAIAWAFKTYPVPGQFCILQKEYVDKNSGLATKVYAISTQLEVDGYDFAFDDLIPDSAKICLSVGDAEKYVELNSKSVTKSLS